MCVKMFVPKYVCINPSVSSTRISLLEIPGQKRRDPVPRDSEQNGMVSHKKCDNLKVKKKCLKLRCFSMKIKPGKGEGISLKWLYSHFRSPEKTPFRISFQKYSISRGKTGRDFPKKYYPISPIFNFSGGTGRDFPKMRIPFPEFPFSWQIEAL